MSTALCFNEITLSPVTHQNSPWIRAAELARALGYSSENLVSRIYKRNAEEFTNDMTQVIEIGAEDQFGSLGRARIFSLRGCHLIAMFARTPVAKEFRRWVLDVLDKLAAEERQALTSPQQFTPSTSEDRKPLRSLVGAWSKASGLHYDALWPQVRAHFNVERVDHIPVEWLPDALAFVQGKIDECAQSPAKSGRKALGRGIKALPPAAPFIPEKGREAMEHLLALRGTLYRVGSEMRDIIGAPFWDSPVRPCPEHFKPFAKAMNSATWAFMMSVDKELETATLLFEAFVEAEKVLRNPAFAQQEAAYE